jgi:hypothetical protein
MLQNLYINLLFIYFYQYLRIFYNYYIYHKNIRKPVLNFYLFVSIINLPLIFGFFHFH